MQCLCFLGAKIDLVQKQREKQSLVNATKDKCKPTAQAVR